MIETSIWIFTATLAAFIVFFALQQFILGIRLSAHHPDRGPLWFNAAILLVLAGGLLYGGNLLVTHHRELSKMIPPYPLARYAPEREPFTPTNTWVYVTHESTDEIVQFYHDEAPRWVYTLVVNRGTTTSRILFSQATKQMFLTIEEKGDKRILYYSEDGNAYISR
jgi:hypothetical protein